MDFTASLMSEVQDWNWRLITLNLGLQLRKTEKKNWTLSKQRCITRPQSYCRGNSLQSYLDPFIFLSILACRNHHCDAWKMFVQVQIITNANFHTYLTPNQPTRMGEHLTQKVWRMAQKSLVEGFWTVIQGCGIFWNIVFCKVLCGVSFFLFFSYLTTSGHATPPWMCRAEISR